jgi:dephospho-CoA kinase
MVKRIGLTGGIASGKSTVGQWLTDQGVPVIDTDQIVHALLTNDPDTLAWVAQHFGPSVMAADGSVNRKALGEVVFADPEKRRLLEGYLHPKVRQNVAQFFEVHAQDRLAVAMVPLLFETQSQHLYDEVWVVAASPETQLARLMQTRGLTEAHARQRIASQWPLADKLALADRVIHNDGDLSSLITQLAFMSHR